MSRMSITVDQTKQWTLFVSKSRAAKRAMIGLKHLREFEKMVLQLRRQ